MLCSRPSFAVNAAVALVVAGVVQAQSINLTLDYVDSFHSDYSSFGTALYPPASTVVSSDYHQFDVLMELGGLSSGEHFQGLQFDVNLGAGLSIETFGGSTGYFASNPTYDPAGPPPAVSLFSTNTDAGTDADDLVRIVVLALSETALAGLEPGESGPFKIGEFYLNWDGSTATSMSISHNGNFPFSTQTSGTPSNHGPGAFTGGTLPIPIPEPATLAILSFASLLGLRRRS